MPLASLLSEIVTMLAVRNLEQAVDFYQHKLAFDLIDLQDHIAALRLGKTGLYLFTHSPPTPDKPGVTLTNLNREDSAPVILDFLVTDCQAAYEQLRTRGVEFLTPPHTPPWGGQRCFARDPDGYLIELEQNPDSPFSRQAASADE